MLKDRSTPIQPYRLAVINSHPIQYFAPLYRRLALDGEVELKVFFGSSYGTTPSFDREFNRPVEFDIPLLKEYDWEFLQNRGSGRPDGRFLHFDCPGIETKLRQGGFDAVWIHGWGYRAQWQAIRAARRLSIPYLIRAETHTLTRSRNLIRRCGRRFFLSRMLCRAAGCFYVGRRSHRFLESMGVSSSKLFPAHYSVDTTRFLNTPLSQDDRREIRRRHGADDDSFVVATSGKLIPLKRIDDVIRAVGLLESHVQLWVLGDGPQKKALQQLAAQVAPARVHWHDFVNQTEMPQRLKAADALVLASDSETWGLVLNEAMACGLPVVASDRVGAADDLIHPAETGFLYESGDVQALAECLSTLASDRELCRRMGLASRKLVTSDYDIAKTSQQIADACMEVTTNRRGRKGVGSHL